MGLLIDNPIGSVQLQLRGGWKNLLFTTGGTAVLIALIMIVWFGSDPKHVHSAAQGWAITLMVLQSLIVLIGMLRVSSAVRQDQNTGLAESHRLMPVTGFSACIGYVMGPTAVLVAMAAINVVAGLVATQIAGSDPGRFLWLNAVLLAFFIFGCVCSVLLGFYSRLAFSLISALLVLASISGGMLLFAVPGMLLLVLPVARNTIFGLTSQGQAYNPIELLGFAAQIIVGGLILAGAARKFRRPDTAAFPVILGLPLLFAWIILNLLGLFAWDDLSPVMFRGSDPSEVHIRVQFVGTMLSAMLLTLLPLAAAVRQRRNADRTYSPGVFLTSMLCVGIIIPMLGVPALEVPHIANGTLAAVGIMLVAGIISFVSLLTIFRGSPRSTGSLIALFLFLIWAVPLIIDVIYHMMLSSDDQDTAKWWFSTFGPVGVLVGTWDHALSLWQGVTFQAVVAVGLLTLSLVLDRKRRPKNQVVSAA